MLGNAIDIRKSLGPGILFAGAAIGVSHLVQSTRAGAVYGLELIPIILLTLVLKYPAFLFGPLYSSVTGQRLIEGYKDAGRWTVLLVTFIFLSVMFTVVAAVSLFTAGLALAITNIKMNPLGASFLVITLCAGILYFGKFRLLKKIMKPIFALLTLSTLAALFLVLPKLSLEGIKFIPTFDLFRSPHIFFLIALIGWMPAGLDLPIMNSQWVLEQKGKTVRGTILDFNVGYVSTGILALAFVLLGTALMHGRGIAFEDSAPKFAIQILQLFSETIGPWSKWVIGPSLFLIMFSTTLTVLDGFPRVLSELLKEARLQFPATQSIFSANHTYRIALGIQIAGSGVVLLLFVSSLKSMVDFATTISFLVGPIFAFLNHRAVTNAAFQKKYPVPQSLQTLSKVGIVFFTLFSAYFLATKLY